MQKWVREISKQSAQCSEVLYAYIGLVGMWHQWKFFEKLDDGCLLRRGRITIAYTIDSEMTDDENPRRHRPHKGTVILFRRPLKRKVDQLR